MKFAAAFAVLVLSAAFSTAQAGDESLSVAEITQKVSESVDHYAAAIACESAPVDPKDIAALVPYRKSDEDDFAQAEYAVIWHGDVGCAGGSGTGTSNIAIVRVGHWGEFFVVPARSSPIAKFGLPVTFIDRMLGNTRNTLLLEGEALGKDDLPCCPSVRVRFTMKLGANGNWTVVNQRVLEAGKPG
jgi:hypothetical protein